MCKKEISKGSNFYIRLFKIKNQQKWKLKVILNVDKVYFRHNWKHNLKRKGLSKDNMDVWTWFRRQLKSGIVNGHNR
jgi:hypothetical protein